MPENEHAALRTFLVGKGGLTAPQAQAIVGAAAAGRARQVVERLLTAWLQNRPKATR